jgi:DNA-binding MarR family transcriptional regulator/N-acetylglutamate synthase-like GNAT family acetyltransferase
MTELAETVAAVRRFNRFYTRRIGVLDRGHMGSPYALAEVRVMHEIAQQDGVTPKAIGAALGLDAGYLSRIVGRFERDGLVVRARSEADGRSVRLRLTPRGREVFEALQARTVAHVEGLVAGLSSPERGKLAGALSEVERLLGAAAAAGTVILRPHRPGDMGWIIERHATLYHREYGWTGMEALVARICADFLDRDDPLRERCWIAERGGERLGSVMVVDDGEGVARLRLLLLEPAARGLGVGRRLVETAVGFGREAGYREMVLWTQGVLTAARAIYAAVGFEVVETRTVEDFGAHTHSETWRMRL